MLPLRRACRYVVMCRAVDGVLAVHQAHQHARHVVLDVVDVVLDREALGEALAASCFCCPDGGLGLAGFSGMRRVRVKKLVHFVKNLRRGTAKNLPASYEHDEKPWWKVSVAS